ncbi:cation transporter [Clostridium sp. AL.422]|uniref:cation diffusion facilitator family transporter n=1 Tax=Clostridium TaxID=1485 RepID=UPI00293DD7ED|nr:MULTISPECIES: cation transporter [unclassified Clostridium]MDV4149632.1 cation transporter [Clostridium sp. AL.422]
MIQFDGLYSFISLGLALFAITATNFINKKDIIKYPFGKCNVEPIIVIVKSLVLLIMCSITMLSAIKQVMNGGNNVEEGFALGYALISSVGCTLVYLYMKKTSKNLNSEIVKVESNQWLMDAMLSIGVLVGFLVSILLKYIGLASISKYVDPGMVILSSCIFLRMPLTSIIEAFKELIYSSANEEINYDIKTLVKEIEKEYNLEDSISRVAKIGRELRIEIDFIISNESKIKSIEDMDKVREIIDKNTNHFDLKKWLNISFTKNKKWAI